jgi:hypothetical protein
MAQKAPSRLVGSKSHQQVCFQRVAEVSKARKGGSIRCTLFYPLSRLAKQKAGGSALGKQLANHALLFP